MSREIKFRGRTKEGEWLIGDLIHGALTASSYTVDFAIHMKGYYPIEVDGEALGQFTGLKDKNGKEIYEGDKLHVDGELLGDVIFSDGAFRIFDIHANCTDSPICFDRAKRLEIIGNIHETPELLK